MQINSVYFVFLFLPLFLLLYLLISESVKIHFLVIASFLFYYLGEGRLVLLLLLITLVNHCLARWLQGPRSARISKILVTAGILFNAGILFYHKYTLFLLYSLISLVKMPRFDSLALPDIVLPAGISFISFHGISFVVDVYRGKIDQPVRLIHSGLYFSFFPKLITGPIARYSDFIRQVLHPGGLSPRLPRGIQRFVIGLGKKAVIADTLAGMNDQIFAIPAGSHTPVLAWLGIIGYTLQIYYDFSGYTDMAIGLGDMCGLQLPENFNFPYIADSIKDFWKRWHISLARWLQEYLFLPIAYKVLRKMPPDRYPGKGPENIAYYLGAMGTMTVCGIWHGARWTFFWWGIYYGVFLVIEHAVWGKRLKRFPRIFRIGYSLLVVMFGWVIFRSGSMAEALDYLQALLGAGGEPAVYYPALYLNGEVLVMMGVGILGSVPFSRWVRSWYRERMKQPRLGMFLQGGFTVGLLLILLLGTLYLVTGGYNPFIYFRF